WPRTVRIASRSCGSRSVSSVTSTTVTSFASSRARWYAAVLPTWPAPRMMILMWGFGIWPLGAGSKKGLVAHYCPMPGAQSPVPGCQLSYRLQVGVRHHQPFGALGLEVDLHTRMAALAFEAQDHAFAEFSVSYPLTEPHSAKGAVVLHAMPRRRVDRP